MPKDSMFAYATCSGDIGTLPDVLAAQTTAPMGETGWCLTALHKQGDCKNHETMTTRYIQQAHMLL